MIQLPAGYECPRAYFDALYGFILNYGHLWTFHAVDFFTHNYWTSNIFPEEWKFLKDGNVTYDELLALASSGTVKDDWPASLKEFTQLSRSIALPRDVANIPLVTEIDAEALTLDNKVIYGMSPKKRHEVRLLSCLIDKVARKQEATTIIDFGAGQGYLDAVLAYTYKHTVIGIDDDDIQTCGAKRRTTHIQKLFSGPKNRHREVGKVYHINRRVQLGEKFADLLAEVEQTNTSQKEVTRPKEDHWLLCGLHACGDLSATLIRHFLTSDARALVSVGCCYNHITENENRDNSSCLPEYGFPLSKYATRSEVMLGFTARMLACQATCRWVEEGEAAKETFSRHFYRALLQQVIVDMKLLPTENEIVVGRLGRPAFGHGFVAYAKAAFERLGVDMKKFGLTDEILQEYETSYHHRQKEIAVIWTLRAMMAESIESLILLDRYLALVEAGVDASLFPLFDHRKSPRNMVLVATKPI
ncbi:hypothetical protein HDU85_004145 [Gaertneriomyces sp. JEL0708]|nr:hypothetical protein HDU85_004145 [Gaertneriomyces sp. JEL0708]